MKKSPILLSSFFLARIKKELQENNKPLLSKEIKEVHIHKKKVGIITGNPLVNNELLHEKKFLLSCVADACEELEIPICTHVFFK